MIGTLWEMAAPEVNPYVYVIVEKSSPNTWKLFELTTGIVVHAWEHQNGVMKLIGAGVYTQIYRFTP